MKSIDWELLWHALLGSAIGAAVYPEIYGFIFSAGKLSRFTAAIVGGIGGMSYHLTGRKP